jgi:hypothetical protein
MINRSTNKYSWTYDQLEKEWLLTDKNSGALVEGWRGDPEAEIYYERGKVIAFRNANDKFYIMKLSIEVESQEDVNRLLKIGAFL